MTAETCKLHLTLFLGQARTEKVIIVMNCWLQMLDWLFESSEWC